MTDTTASDADLSALLLHEVLSKLFKEYWPRLEQCLNETDTALLWAKPNSNSNSIGTLVLHLEGNVRQWIMHGVSGKKDVRHRKIEFDPIRQLSKAELLKLMAQLQTDVKPVISGLSAQELFENRRIQGFDTTVWGALFHVVEHFSFHLGQITYIVKLNRNIDLGYYDGYSLGADNDL